MKIQIVHNTAKLFNVNVTENTSVFDLKQAISRRINVPLEDLVLTVRGTYLEEGNVLKRYRLPRPDFIVPIELHLSGAVHQKPPITIRVSVSPRVQVMVPFRRHHTVGDLRAYLTTQGNRPPLADDPNALLVFGHHLLQDDQPLISYGIKKNSLITVAKHLPSISSTTSAVNDVKPYNYMDEFDKNFLDQEDDIVDTQIKVRFVLTGSSGPSADSLTLSLHPDATLYEVSKHVEWKAGIPAENQSFSLKEELTHQAESLDLRKSLADLGVRDGARIYLTDTRRGAGGRSFVGPSASPAAAGAMLIHFKDAVFTHSVNLAADATVEEAMAALKARIGGSRGPLWIKSSVDGNFMQHHSAKLVDLGIKPGDTLEYVHVPVRSERIAQ